MWGQVIARKSSTIFLGIIPTRVGTRSARYMKPSPTKGSSPRVWGQAGKTTDFAKFLRIIPTRVGTRASQLLFANCKKDHPHACGDKKLSYSLHIEGVGSSPRVWGQAESGEISEVGYRIIPTRVGTSSALEYVPISFEDHPHACGDKLTKTKP